jgi:hypothetical protein
MTSSINPATPPDFAALLANLASHRQQAQDMLGQAGPSTHHATLIQGAIAHAMTGLLLVAEAMTAELAAELAATDDVLTEPEAAPRERTTARVRVFLNNAFGGSFLRGYQAGNTVTEVFAYDETNLDAETDDLVLAERAFELLNIGDDPSFGAPDQRAVDYRCRGNRSLSVGDVIAIDDRFWSCDSFGWRELDEQPVIQQRWEHGIAPLYD